MVAIMPAGNILSSVLTFWHDADSNEESNLSNNHNNNNIISSSNYKSLINNISAIQHGSVKSVLKHLYSNCSQQINIGHQVI